MMNGSTLEAGFMVDRRSISDPPADRPSFPETRFADPPKHDL
jgi:hypothetical protein